MPVVVGIAVSTFLTWYFVVSPGNFAESLTSMIAVLVIACPCALGLATPTSIMAGSGRAAEQGVLFKTAEAMENTKAIDTVVLDKTGTITKGAPEVTDFIVVDNADRDRLIAIAAAAESDSEHPVAKAITVYGLELVNELPIVTLFEAIPGHGIKSVIGGSTVFMGTRKLLADNEITLNATISDAEEFENDGKTVMYMAVSGAHVATLAVADTLK